MQPRIFLERTAKILSQILLDDEKEKDEQLQLWRAKNMKKKNDWQLAKLQQLEKKGEKKPRSVHLRKQEPRKIYIEQIYSISPSSIY